MSVLGIDPGPDSSAWLEWDPATEQIIACGEEPSLATCERVREAAFRGIRVAIEAVTCYGAPVGKETYETCYWIGEMRRICRGAKYEAQIVPYRDISRNLCRIAGANDTQVYAALKERFGAPGTVKAPGMLFPLKGKEHIRSALAVAIYVGDTQEKTTELSMKMRGNSGAR